MFRQVRSTQNTPFPFLFRENNSWKPLTFFLSHFIQCILKDDADFWDELWKIPSSAEEVFELISPSAARTLRDQRFDNLATLFTQATAQLCQIVETPYNIYFDQALNCVRVLTRVLPFLLEKGVIFS